MATKMTVQFNLFGKHVCITYYWSCALPWSQDDDAADQLHQQQQ
jgi:hypothetical protein